MCVCVCFSSIWLIDKTIWPQLTHLSYRNWIPPQMWLLTGHFHSPPDGCRCCTQWKEVSQTLREKTDHFHYTSTPHTEDSLSTCSFINAEVRLCSSVNHLHPDACLLGFCSLESNKIMSALRGNNNCQWMLYGLSERQCQWCLYCPHKLKSLIPKWERKSAALAA